MSCTLLLLAVLAQGSASVPAPMSESRYWQIESFTPPEELVLEVGGLALLPDGRPILSTRRGEVYIVEGAYGDPSEAEFKLFCDGLHEPLGLLVHDGWIYTAQRGELSRMRDSNGDDRLDELETICDAWPISGNYHEYNFGPRLDDEGNFWITTNKPFGDEPFGRAKWRGFALRITPEGEMLPTCSGLRSPAGLEKSPWGDLFYTDNQGEWCGASKLSVLRPGSFHGHPWGIFSCEDPLWPYGPVAQPPDGEPMAQAAKRYENFELPAVWFPYGKMGQSPAGMLWDTTEGGFGPFAGQLLVGDQHHSSVLRVCLEEVDGHWQGACIPMRSGFMSGVLRLAWGTDDTLFVGCTNRGWGSNGRAAQGFERARWTGVTPFEIHSMRATPKGFRLHFTHELDPASLPEAAFSLESYTYLLHSPYGSPETQRATLAVTEVSLDAGARSVLLTVDGLRAGFVHELHIRGLRSTSGESLLHPEAYYTLMRRPTQ